VEGIRRDVRVINYSLLGIDWYINQLRYKINESAPIEMVWDADKIEGSKRDFVRYYEKPGISDQNRFVDLYSLMKDFVGSDDPVNQVPMQDGSYINYYPVKKVSVPVDINMVRSNGTVNANDSVVSELRFEISKNILMKNDLAVLNVIAANKWKRPIYFTSPGSQGLGFDNYLRSDGMSYRLVPIAITPENSVNSDWAKNALLTKFSYGNASAKGVYYDEENRRHLISIRQAYAEAASNLAGQGRREDAKALLNKVDKGMAEENMPYGMVSRGNQHNMVSIQLIEAAYKADDQQLASKISTRVRKDLDEQLAYYANLGGMSIPEMRQAVQDIMENKADNLSNRQKGVFQEMRMAFGLKDYLDNIERSFKNPAPRVPETPGVINNK
jgi:hypothetical protein